ncbi:ADP-ribosylglycohydrolase family protein [Cohnella soli]|uniref:ADP-ribosylglycohydrolase family protein n=1 Tax=Cohnella soli TaxID=425005 RepID=A0ABW0HUV4_9BACL
MKLSIAEYRDKLAGCWLGKNVGGTLGAPFECKRGIFDVTFYTQDLKGEPVPNDDLDLQLVWLNAIEKHGRSVDARILGEYWLSYVTPNWCEYGAGKNNMRAGLVPPLAGHVHNVFRDSCGAFIRSEIWACLAPGHPEIAVQYAYEDAIVDHSGEGVYAEVFCAAVESAAFVESDVYKLIDIGLSYIPADCGIAKGIHTALDAYRSGLSWQEARSRVLHAVPGSFGIIGMTAEELAADDIPIGEMGYDAPSNIGLTIVAWLYGENDFGNTVCIATNCGEDTDCTAATVGSILGIIHGAKGLPAKWTEPIGDSIKTLCINLGDQGLRVPKTVTELTNRIMKLAPSFLGSDLCDTLCDEPGYVIEMREPEQLSHRPERINSWIDRSFFDHLALAPFTVKYDFVIFSSYLDYGAEPFIREDQPITLKLKLENKLYMQQYLQLNWHMPDEWDISPSRKSAIPLEQYHANVGTATVNFTITPRQLKQSRYDLILEVIAEGRPTKGLIPIVLIHSSL